MILTSSFLSAGINYEVDISVNSDKDAITKLYYIGNTETPNEVEKIKKHLSWGEKNAFALILFMFYAISKNPDIIILDDPISSFDSNKKYAIINRLFANNANVESFYKKTLLMLTHDFEPIIDFVVNKKPTGGFLTASFIKNNNGVIIEKAIVKDKGFESYIKMLTKYVRREEINYISRLVFLRQLIEHISDSHEEIIAYNLISSLLHGNNVATIKEDCGHEREATVKEINQGNIYIEKYIKGFDYEKFSTEYFTKKYLEKTFKGLSNNYLKIQIFRAYISILECRVLIENDVLLKFIDEMYHIENDYIYYLDLLEYDIVPEHIVDECNNFFESL